VSVLQSCSFSIFEQADPKKEYVEDVYHNEHEQEREPRPNARFAFRLFPS
jgi:hypothetical protein